MTCGSAYPTLWCRRRGVSSSYFEDPAGATKLSSLRFIRSGRQIDFGIIKVFMLGIALYEFPKLPTDSPRPDRRGRCGAAAHASLMLNHKWL